jgi:hypothetical protein
MGWNMGVRATDARFLDLVSRYFSAFKTEAPAAEETLFSADCGGERTLPGGRVIRGKKNLYWSGMNIFHGDGDLEMAARVISFVRNIGSEQTNEFVRFRAGAVGIGESAILFPEPESPRLAGLMALLVRRGTGYLGDDMVNLDPILRRIHPLELPLMVDVDDLALLPELERTASRVRDLNRSGFARSAMHRQPVAVEELDGRISPPAPVGWIVFPDFRDGEETRLEPAGGAEALFRFTQSRLNLHVWGERALILMRELLESVPVSRLVVGDPSAAAEIVMESAADVLEGVNQ